MSQTETVKLPTYQRQLIPVSEAEGEELRRIVVRAVFSVWNREGRPTDLREIYRFYQLHAPEDKPLWSKRTIDRRVNEAASPLYAENGVPKIVAVTAGIYQVNPRLFLNEEKPPESRRQV